MNKRILVGLSGMLILLFAFFSFAQYTGFDLEAKRPPTLLPTAGPGDRAIVYQLQQTNRLLEQNNQLLIDQNRLLQQLVQRSRPKSKIK